MKVLHSVEYHSNAANEVLNLNENNREANREASLHTKRGDIRQPITVISRKMKNYSFIIRMSSNSGLNDF